MILNGFSYGPHKKTESSFYQGDSEVRVSLLRGQVREPGELKASSRIPEGGRICGEMDRDRDRVRDGARDRDRDEDREEMEIGMKVEA